MGADVQKPMNMPILGVESASVSFSENPLADEWSTYLHLPPIHPGIGLQLIVPDTHLVSNHPAEKAQLKRGQAKDVGLRSSQKRFWAVLSRHRCYAEVLEDDTEQQCERVIYQKRRP